MIINQLRTYFLNRTASRLFVDGVQQAHTVLEDAGKPLGVKIPGETPIPEGVYRVKITTSPKFKKDMMILHNVNSDLSIQRHGVTFTGVRVHAGTKVEHTDGCPLYMDYEALQARVQTALDKNEDVLWIISEDLK